MIRDFNFKLKNVGLINNADINLSKINVIAGDNSTGKSTSSKILYSFLRSNSKTRKELAKTTLIDEILDLASEINSFYRFSEFENKNRVQKKSELSEIINEIRMNKFKGKDIDIVNHYKKIKNIFQEYTLKYTGTNLFDKSISDMTS